MLKCKKYFDYLIKISNLGPVGGNDLITLKKLPFLCLKNSVLQAGLKTFLIRQGKHSGSVSEKIQINF